MTKIITGNTELTIQYKNMSLDGLVHYHDGESQWWGYRLFVDNKYTYHSDRLSVTPGQALDKFFADCAVTKKL